MQLVDEQNDLPLCLLDLFKDGLQAVLELAAVLRTGQHRPEVERYKFFVLKGFRDVARDDPLREALDDRRFTNAGFADQNRVVLGPAGKDLDRAADLVVSADDRIELAFAGSFGKVLSVFLECLEVLLGVLIGDLAAPAHVGDDLFEVLTRNPVRAKDAAGIAVLFSGDGEQQVLGGDVFILHPLGFLLGGLEYGVRAGTEVLLPAGNLRELSDRGLHLGQDLPGVRTDLAEDGAYDALFLLEHHREDVLRLDLLVLAAFRERDRFLNGFLAPDRESVESHCCCSRFTAYSNLINLPRFDNYGLAPRADAPAPRANPSTV